MSNKYKEFLDDLNELMLAHNVDNVLIVYSIEDDFCINVINHLSEKGKMNKLAETFNEISDSIKAKIDNNEFPIFEV